MKPNETCFTSFTSLDVLVVLDMWECSSKTYFKLTIEMLQLPSCTCIYIFLYCCIFIFIAIALSFFLGSFETKPILKWPFQIMQLPAVELSDLFANLTQSIKKSIPRVNIGHQIFDIEYLKSKLKKLDIWNLFNWYRSYS